MRCPGLCIRNHAQRWIITRKCVRQNSIPSTSSSVAADVSFDMDERTTVNIEIMSILPHCGSESRDPDVDSIHLACLNLEQACDLLWNRWYYISEKYRKHVSSIIIWQLSWRHLFNHNLFACRYDHQVPSDHHDGTTRTSHRPPDNIAQVRLIVSLTNPCMRQKLSGPYVGH